ncbi:hypothetical protein HDU91_001093, partial [Kappamyces sp. JEL0680]
MQLSVWTRYLLVGVSAALASNVTIWMESSYATSDYCKGSPDAIKFYTMLATNGYGAYPYDICGNGGYAIRNQCCYSSLDLSDGQGTSGLLSAAIYPLEQVSDPLEYNLRETELEQWAPLLANGNSYCYLKRSAFLARPTESLLGYLSMLYRSDAGCINAALHSYYCHGNGTLRIYDASHCVGPFESVGLNDSLHQYPSSRLLGSFQGRMLHVENATQTMGWTAYIPDIYLVPNFTNTLEIVALVGFILALMAQLATLIWSAVQFLHNYQNYQMIALFSSHLLWFAWLCLRMAYVYTVFTDEKSLYMVQTPMNYLKALATLGT